MSGVVTIGRTDLVDACRSRIVWAAVGLMGLLAASNTAAGPELIRSSSQPVLLTLLQFTLWLPLFAIVLGYAAVTEEQESGRIRVLLGQPATRRDVVVGKLLSRTVVLLSALAIVIILATSLVTVWVGLPDPLAVVAGAVGVVLYGLAWLGASVGISAIAANGKQALGALLVAYLLCNLLWESFIARLLALVVAGSADLGTLVEFADPEVITYANGSTWFLYAFRFAPAESFSGTVFYVYELLRAVVTGNPTGVAHGPNLFGVAVLLAWAVVPLAVGHWRLRRTDLE